MSLLETIQAQAMHERVRRETYENLPQEATYLGHKCVVTHHPSFFNESWFETGDDPENTREDWLQYWKLHGRVNRERFPDYFDAGRGFLGAGYQLERAAGLAGYPRHWTLENPLFSDKNPGWRTWRVLPHNEYRSGRFGIEPSSSFESAHLIGEIVKADGGGAFILPPSMVQHLHQGRSFNEIEQSFGRNIRVVQAFEANILYNIVDAAARRHGEGRVISKPRVVVIIVDLFGL